MVTRRAVLNGITLSGLALMLGTTALPSYASRKTWALANDYPAGSLPGQADMQFADLVSSKSNGQLKINVYLGGSLGFSSAQLLDSVGSGALEMADASTAWYGGADPFFFAPAIPFFANTPQRLRDFYTVSQSYYEKALERFNHKLLYAVPWTSSSIWAKQPITSSKELAGLKLRVGDKFAAEFFGRLGANPVQTAWGDVLPQVTTGALDAVVAGTEAGIPSKFHEHMKYYIDIDYNIGLNICSVNIDLFNSLSDEEKEVFLESAREVQDGLWDVAITRTTENLEKLKGHGVTVISEVDPELKARFSRESESILNEWADLVGDRAHDVMRKYGTG